MIGGGVGFCLSFYTTVPILAVHGFTAALLTTALSVSLYQQGRNMRRYNSKKDYLKLLGTCVASMVVTEMLSMLIHPLLSGTVSTSLIPVVTGLI